MGGGEVTGPIISSTRLKRQTGHSSSLLNICEQIAAEQSLKCM